MIGFLKNLFGAKPAVDYKALVAEGAVVVDVRSPQEFASGHIKGAINIPVNALQANIQRLKGKKHIITCCASGMRSGMAKTMLQKMGYESVHNGGSWTSLENELR